MRISDVHVDGFGGLTGLRLADLGPGLNVVYGPQSACPAVMEFLRGVFAGFHTARERGWLPTGSGAVVGGAVGVEWGSRKLAVIRHARRDGSETLAINVREGLAGEASTLRKQLEAIDELRLRTLFTASRDESTPVEALLKLAHEDGIELSATAADEAWLRGHREELRRRRHELMSGPQHEGRISVLIAERDTAMKERDLLRFERTRRLRELDETLERLTVSTGLLQDEIAQRHTDWQATVADLREVEGRLTGRRFETVVDVEYIQEQAPLPPTRFRAEVASLDEQIERIRQVLRDLAETRLRVTLEGLDIAGADTPGPEEHGRRQREGLRVVEQQVQALSATLIGFGQADADENQEALLERATSAVDELRRRVEWSCQELSRQQSVLRLAALGDDRQSIDDCETQLMSQLRRLRQQRERLIEADDNPAACRLVHPASFERRHCECAEHTSTNRTATPRTQTRQVTLERVQEVSTAREGDAELRDQLLRLAREQWQGWQDSLTRRAAWEVELHKLDEQSRQCRQDRRLEAAEERLANAEAVLASTQKAWQTLLSVEAALRQVELDWSAGGASRVICEASQHLSAMTEGRQQGIRLDGETEEVRLIGDLPAGPNDASEGDRLDLPALALRIALLDEYARRGLEFPLVLEDLLVDRDEDRLRRAIEVLAQAARRGRQVIVLTSQEALVEQMEEAGAAVQVLPGAERTLTSQAVQEIELPETDGECELVAPVVVADGPELPTPAPVELAEPVLDDAFPFAPKTAAPRLTRSSTLEVVASICTSHCARLDRIGIRTLGDLLDASPDRAMLTTLQVDRSILDTWQAEARLLLDAPGLSPADAQLLAACGVVSAEELSRFEDFELYRRIQRFRGSAPPVWHEWIQKRQTWPREHEVRQWIGWARIASELAVPHPEPISLPFPNDAADVPPPTDPDPDPQSGHPGRKSKRERRENRRRGSKGSQRGSGRRAAFLSLESPIIDAPAVGPKTSKLLQRAGISTVAHLLSRTPSEISRTIKHRDVSAEVVEAWQFQSQLMCELPGLRGHDAQLLVACGVRTVDLVALHTPEELFALIGPFARTRDGQRMLRSSSPPTLEEVTDWIQAAGDARAQRAA